MAHPDTGNGEPQDTAQPATPEPMPPPRRSRLSAWAELLRVGNLPTVPGDVLGGFIVAGVGLGGAAALDGRVALAAAGSLLLYAAGALQNDYFDLEADRRDRPRRPLPSGRVRPATAIVTAFVLAGLGVAAARVAALASGAAAAVLLVVEALYNREAKHVPILGPLILGACRALSLLVGAGLWGWAGLSCTGVVVSAVCLTALVACISQIGTRETPDGPVGAARWLPAAVIAAWFVVLHAAAGLHLTVPERVASGALAGMAVLWAALCGRALAGSPDAAARRQVAGMLLRGLLLVQAALAATAETPGFIVAGSILLAWPVAKRLSARFSPD